MAHPFNADSRAKSRSYIINNDTGEKLVFQFNPTSVPYSRGAEYSEIKAPLMSYPLTQYAGGTSRSFKVELFMYDRPSSGKIEEARLKLESYLPPEYNDPEFIKPPSLTFAFGYFVKKCVLEQLEVNDELFDENGNPTQTRFTLSLKQIGI